MVVNSHMCTCTMFNTMFYTMYKKRMMKIMYFPGGYLFDQHIVFTIRMMHFIWLMLTEKCVLIDFV